MYARKFSILLTPGNEVTQADLLQRLRWSFEAKHLARQVVKSSQKRTWNVDRAGAYLVLARVSIGNKRVEEAKGYLEEAEEVARRGHLQTLLPSILTLRAFAAQSAGDLPTALSCCDEAMSISSSRGLELVRADALNVRASIHLAMAKEQPNSPRVEDVLATLDDAEAALQVAQRTGYIWAKRNAYNLLWNAQASLGRNDVAETIRQQADNLDTQLNVVPSHLRKKMSNAMWNND